MLIAYSKYFVLFRLIVLMLFIIVSPLSANVMTYLTFSFPNQLLAICLIACNSGENSNMLKFSLFILSPDTDV
jgi:hypothetical protein